MPRRKPTRIVGPRCKCGHLYAVHTAEHGCGVEQLVANRGGHTFRKVVCKCKARKAGKWVNKAGGVAMRDPMNDAQAKSFAQRMKGKLIAHKATYGGPREQKLAANGNQREQQRRAAQGGGGFESQTPDDDIPF